jgi:hypothetical protein
LDDYSETEIEALLAYLNSSVANEIAKRSGRTYSRGLHKIEPDELKDIPVVDPDDLTKKEVEVLAKKFRDLCDAARTDNENLDSAISKLDTKVIEVISPGQQVLDLPRRESD